jgi:hypothetical protein
MGRDKDIDDSPYVMGVRSGFATAGFLTWKLLLHEEGGSPSAPSIPWELGGQWRIYLLLASQIAFSFIGEYTNKRKLKTTLVLLLTSRFFPRRCVSFLLSFHFFF